MAIVFPISPSVNDTFTSGSITYKWDGQKWIGLGVTPADRLIEGSNSLEIDASNNLLWSGGKVGFDAPSPESKLEVRDSLATGVIIRSTNTQSTNTNKALRVRNNSADNTFWVSYKGFTQITINDDTDYSTNTTNTSNTTNTVLTLSNQSGSDGTGVNNYVGINFSVANGATSTAQLQYVRTGDNAGKFEFKARNGSTNYPNLLTLKSNNDIGINKPDPQQWGGGVPTIEIKGTVATGGNATRSGAIAFESGSGSDGYAVLWGQEGGIHIYTSATDRDASTFSSKFHSDGNLHFASGKGIDFSANANATGMTSELLDDYEEGTFTPSILGSSANPSYTVETNRSQYTKIGRLVDCTVDINITGLTGGSGQVYVTLPFNAQNNTPKPYAELIGGRNNTWFNGANNTLFGWTVENTNAGYIVYQTGNNGAETNAIWGTNNNTGSVRFCLHYLYYTDT